MANVTEKEWTAVLVFIFFIGIPAMIGWLVLGFCWLAAARMGIAPDDFTTMLRMTRNIVGSYYLFAFIVAVLAH